MTLSSFSSVINTQKKGIGDMYLTNNWTILLKSLNIFDLSLKQYFFKVFQKVEWGTKHSLMPGIKKHSGVNLLFF